MNIYAGGILQKRRSPKRGVGTYKMNRYRIDIPDAVHFNNNGKKACTINVTDPSHSTHPEKVTCKNCLVFLQKKKA